MKITSILFGALCLGLGFAALGGRGSVGGYSDVQDTTQIQQQINFAVRSVVENNQDYVLHYANLISAKQQIVAGVNYEFVLQFDVLASKTGQTGIPATVDFKVNVHQALDQSLSVMSAVQVSSRNQPPQKCAPGAPCSHSTSDPWAQKAAAFAVKSISTENNLALSLTQIISVKTQIVAGVNYIMVLRLSANGQTADFDVTVYRDLHDKLSLVSWKQQQVGQGQLPVLEPGPVIGGTGLGHQGQGTLLGGYQKVNMQDPMMNAIVTAAAKFALKQIGIETSQSLRFLAVNDVMKQVVAGTNFQFDVEGATNPGSKVYSSKVFMPLNVAQYLSNPANIPFELKSYKETVISLPR